MLAVTLKHLCFQTILSYTARPLFSPKGYSSLSHYRTHFRSRIPLERKVFNSRPQNVVHSHFGKMCNSVKDLYTFSRITVCQNWKLFSRMGYAACHLHINSKFMYVTILKPIWNHREIFFLNWIWAVSDHLSQTFGPSPRIFWLCMEGSVSSRFFRNCTSHRFVVLACRVKTIFCFIGTTGARIIVVASFRQKFHTTAMTIVYSDAPVIIRLPVF